MIEAGQARYIIRLGWGGGRDGRGGVVDLYKV